MTNRGTAGDLKHQRTGGEGGFQSFGSLASKGRIYLLAVYCLGASIYMVHMPTMKGQNLWLAIALGVLSGLVGSKMVVDFHGRARFTAETVIQGIAYLVGGLPTVLLSNVISTMIQALLHKNAWYIWLFNLLQLPIQFQILDLSVRGLAAVNPLQSASSIPALLIGFGVASTVHAGLVAIVIFLINGIPIKKSNTFTFLTIIRETCFFCVALSTVMIWEIEPLAILITLSPVYILYTSFQLPFLKTKSEMDQKTGLLNAKTFIDSLETELERAKRFHRPLSLVMADLDYMRNINNTHGHLVGDRVLIEVGNTLKKVFREFDTIARFGGEEFAIILPETSRENVIHVVERARRAIQEMSIKTETMDEPLQVTMSFGIAQRSDVPGTVADLINHADMALYHAKGSGRNCIGIYRDSRVLCVTMPFSVPIEHPIDS
jgi:diguanylate cyclase (GGDEF)-like protein